MTEGLIVKTAIAIPTSSWPAHGRTIDTEPMDSAVHDHRPTGSGSFWFEAPTADARQRSI